MHVIYQPQVDAPCEDSRSTRVTTIEGDEARHAVRVKRLEVGDGVLVLNGRGLEMSATVAGVRKERGRGDGDWVMDLRVDAARVVPRTRPSLRVFSGVPKGDRLEQMVDGLSQVGTAAWCPLMSGRSIVDRGEGKIDRLRRVCEESLKQCGRAWLMEVAERVVYCDAILAAGGGGGEVVIADASGGEYHPGGADSVALFVGPEGGFTPEEVEQARAAGARVCSFGVHTMRVEVAAVVGAAAVMGASIRSRGHR